jgi:hypothetical protein
MTTVKHTHRHPLEDVYAKLVDEAHLRDRCQQAGHRNIQVSVTEKDGAYEIRLERDIESDIPAIAKKFVSPVNHVVDIVRWRDAGDGKAGTYDVTVNPRIRVKGQMTLKPSGSGCVYEDTCSPTVDVPLIGGKIAQIVAKETAAAIAEDQRRTERALG